MMKRGLWLPVPAVILLVAAGLVSGAGPRSPAPPPAISAIRAQLFENKSGQFSADVLDPGYPGAWNTVAGPHAANATLIVVEVSGLRADDPAVQQYSVKLTARETGRQPKLLLSSTQRLPRSNDRGVAYLPFLTYQSGCSPVQVSAVLIGPQAGKPLERTLPFACGE
jgi:hypothetical protein